MGIGFKLVTWLLAAFAVLCGGMAAQAAPGRASGKADAVILRPFKIVKTEDLQFGNVAATNAPGTVVVNPTNGEVTYAGTIGMGGTTSPARALGYGTPRSIVWVRWPTELTLQRVGGGAFMTVTQLRVNNCVLFCFDGSDPRIVPSDGFLDVRLGGQLNVDRNQMEGDYAATFPITIDYP